MKVRVTRQKRRGGKVWVVDWTDRSGKRHQPRFDTKEAAEAEEERIRATLRAQHGRTPELPEDTTWTGRIKPMSYVVPTPAERGWR